MGREGGGEGEEREQNIDREREGERVRGRTEERGEEEGRGGGGKERWKGRERESYVGEGRREKSGSGEGGKGRSPAREKRRKKYFLVEGETWTAFARVLFKEQMQRGCFSLPRHAYPHLMPLSLDCMQVHFTPFIYWQNCELESTICIFFLTNQAEALLKVE